MAHRTILEGLDLRDFLIFWEGRYFLASTWFDEEEKGRRRSSLSGQWYPPLVSP